MNNITNKFHLALHIIRAGTPLIVPLKGTEEPDHFRLLHLPGHGHSKVNSDAFGGNEDRQAGAQWGGLGGCRHNACLDARHL